jgi:peptidoglycan hydrolase CwlO-like protein
MKVRKASYDKLLNKIDEHDRQQETDAVKVDYIREDLASLQSMLDAVSKRIEQLRFDARPGRKR